MDLGSRTLWFQDFLKSEVFYFSFLWLIGKILADIYFSHFLEVGASWKWPCHFLDTHLWFKGPTPCHNWRSSWVGPDEGSPQRFSVPGGRCRNQKPWFSGRANPNKFSDINFHMVWRWQRTKSEIILTRSTSTSYPRKNYSFCPGDQACV